ncbi:MAG: polymer-forming cytoskeletal protein [Kangiellaceae bacterium]|nr:polymer-forming cytoskeletal protein [Kangiellaceae bacterium]
MFGSKKKNSPKAKAGAADTLICKQTKISGDINFDGVLYIDGHVVGNISSEEVENSLLTIGINGFVEGEIRVPHIMILGRVKGDVYALEHVELMTEARIEGDVYYKLIEMSMGAEVNGQMLHTIEKQKLLSHHTKTEKKTIKKKDNTSESDDDKIEIEKPAVEI